MGNSKSQALLCTTAVGVLQLVMPAAFAQPDEAVDSAIDMETVLVRARRVEEDVQKVPVSVTALSASDLKEAHIETTTDVQFVVPGVYLGGNSSRSNPVYTIRGESRSGQFVSSPFGVVLYYADVPLQTNVGASVPPFDLHSVQVLKGPQGTLFGRNTTGGAILTYPVEPAYEYDGYIDAGSGNYGLFEQEAVVNVPLVADKAAVRLGARHQERNGYTRNLAPGGRDQDDLDNLAVRAQLLLEPVSGLSNLTTIDYYESSTAGTGQAYILLSGPNRNDVVPAGGGNLGRGTGDPFANFILPASSGGAVLDEYIEQKGAVNRTVIDLGPATLKNILGYRDSTLHLYTSIAENAGLPTGVPIGTGTFAVATLWDYRQLTEELHLTGNWLGRVDWLLGGFWLRQEPSGLSLTDTDALANGAALIAFFEDSTRAGFINMNVDLGDVLRGLRLSGGYRHSWDKQTVCSGTELGGPIPTPGQPRITKDQCNNTSLQSPTVFTKKGNAPTYSAGLDWQINDDLFTYLVHRHSYKAGGTNVPAFTSPLMMPLQSYEPSTTTDVEIGLKSRFVVEDVRLLFNVAAFRAVQDDVQVMVRPLQQNVFFPNPANCGAAGTPYDGNCNPLDDPFQAQLIVNGGKRVIEGVELETEVAPFEWLSVGASANFQSLHGKEPNTYSANILAAAATGLTNAPDVETLEFFPKTTYSANWRIKLPVNPEHGELLYSGTYYHTGTIDDELYPDMAGYSTVNMRLDWNGFAGLPLDLGLWAQNVTNEVGITNVSPTFGALMGYGKAVLLPPRMYGLELRYRLGAGAER